MTQAATVQHIKESRVPSPELHRPALATRDSRLATEAEPLGELLARRREAVRMMDYQVLGRIDWFRLENGKLIDFGKHGPMLGELETGELVLLDKWRGLPDEISGAGKACPDCQQKCDECKKGKRTCTALGCGGQGFTASSPAECRAPGCAKRAGKFNPECKVCGGSGMIFPRKRCLGCKGSGIVVCGLCRGTSKRPVGMRRGKTCGTCNGNQLIFKRTPRKLADYMLGFLRAKDNEGALLPTVGPITSIVFCDRADPAAVPCELSITPDRHGNLMALLLEGITPGSDMHLIGGVPHLRRAF